MDILKSNQELKMRVNSIWIDIFLVSQDDMLVRNGQGSRLVSETAQRFSSAAEHILFVDKDFFRRAWCLAEVAFRSASGRKMLVCAPRTSTNRKILLNSLNDPFNEMRTTYESDLHYIREEISRQFESPGDFNAKVKEIFVEVKCSLICNEANLYRIGKKQPGKGAGMAMICKNDFRALELYRMAELEGHAESLYWIGHFYDYGRGGLEQDEFQAVEMYQQAAVKGYAPAQAVLGRRYEYGRGLKTEEEKAADARLRAEQAARTEAAAKLAAEAEARKAKGRRGSHVSVAAEPVAPAAPTQVERKKRPARDRAKEAALVDLAQAAAWYRRAADQGLAAAQCDLAEFYEAGKGGLPRDLDAAARLFRAAAAQGYPRAAEKLARMEPKARPEPSFVQRLAASFVARR